jgi:putative hydrolase of the HAD superfamily
MKIRHILFDATGVVVSASMFSVQYQKQFGVSNDEMLPFFRGPFGDCLRGRADLKEAVEPYLGDWKWPGTAAEFLQFWFEAEHQVNKRILDLISDLRKKGMGCYLATNQEKYRTEYIKNEMGLKDYFDQIFPSSEIGFQKPEAGFYKYIFEKINEGSSVSKGEILLVDDSRENVEEADKFGLKGYFYEDFESFSKQLNSLIS